jgi:hypothetical protein
MGERVHQEVSIVAMLPPADKTLTKKGSWVAGDMVQGVLLGNRCNLHTCCCTHKASRLRLLPSTQIGKQLPISLTVHHIAEVGPVHGQLGGHAKVSDLQGERTQVELFPDTATFTNSCHVGSAR